jgi:hypothetical protein
VIHYFPDQGRQVDVEHSREVIEVMIDDRVIVAQDDLEIPLRLQLGLAEGSEK